MQAGGIYASKDASKAGQVSWGPHMAPRRWPLEAMSGAPAQMQGVRRENLCQCHEQEAPGSRDGVERTDLRRI
jgi:hypothetical protein